VQVAALEVFPRSLCVVGLSLLDFMAIKLSVIRTLSRFCSGALLAVPGTALFSFQPFQIFQTTEGILASRISFEHGSVQRFSLIEPAQAD
jgi:hypothetical protein